MKDAIAAGLAVLLPPPAAAETPSPIVLTDINQVVTVAEPAFSPDGMRVAYSVARNDAKQDAAFSDIWVVPWSGGAPRQFTTTIVASEWQPSFSGDGRWIAFLSDAGVKKAGKKAADESKEEKDEDTQLWRVPSAGGAARRITTLPGGISDFNLSPDGARAVVVAEVGAPSAARPRHRRRSRPSASSSSGTARAIWTIARSSCSSSIWPPARRGS